MFIGNQKCGCSHVVQLKTFTRKITGINR